MKNLNKTHLVAFTNKVKSLTESNSASREESFRKDYDACYDASKNVLNEVEFKALREKSMASEEALYAANYIKIQNLKVAIEECQRQIAVEKALSYLIE